MESELSSIDWELVISTGIVFSMLALTHTLLNYKALSIPVGLVGHNRIALWLYTLLVLPGVILHELSHAVTALILLVNVYEFHIGPEIVGDELWLGYIRREKADVFRSSVIGLAPLIAGTGVIYVISNLAFDITHVYNALTSGGWLEAIESLELDFSNGWMWLAVYFIFAVSASMFPSSSDRRGWLPVMLFLLLIFIIGGIAGIVCTLIQWLAEPLNATFQWLMLIFSLTLIVDLPILLLLAAGTRAVTKHPRSV